MKRINKHEGFSLIEVMVVVAIIGLLAAISVPNVLRSRKRSQAAHVLEDLRMLSSAVDQYALETGRAAGFIVHWSDVQQYIKTDTRLYSSPGTDTLGNAFGSSGNFSVDEPLKFSRDTFNALSDVATVEFWSPYEAH